MIATTNKIDSLRTAAGQAGDLKQVELCELALEHGDELDKFARETASDNGSDYAAAVRSMRDESGEVAANVGCSDAVVIAWVKCAEAILDAAGRAD